MPFLDREVRQSQPMRRFTVAALARELQGGKAVPLPEAVPGQAAVAAVLRETQAGLDLLFIRRAERPGDPWSGDIAFPGGHVEAADGSLLAAAVRETREELGLDLERDAELVGALSVVRTHLREEAGPRWVAPFVFALRDAPVLAPSDEVQEAVWVPAGFLLERANRSQLVWSGRGEPMTLPCYRFNGHVIWGLTLKMVDELLEALSRLA
jgi:8-oxo-dGTP pyrophosphatase MutT (NUDIX family)